MKENIIGSLSFPYLDKYVVKVGRQLDRFHMPTERLYVASYSNPEKVLRLYRHFKTLNDLVTKRILEQRIEAWNVTKS